MLSGKNEESSYMKRTRAISFGNELVSKSQTASSSSEHSKWLAESQSRFRNRSTRNRLIAFEKSALNFELFINKRFVFH
ncbi:unnamed protein product [Thelazia callipaeda]|uniref:Uncharacterized protein n=1 Tax=Thelazia callipaeda TaxID=103827 RepID=A0A0N5D008_THECL|nr:unnamed protein product [Thelazia callipaeda]